MNPYDPESGFSTTFNKPYEPNTLALNVIEVSPSKREYSQDNFLPSNM